MFIDHVSLAWPLLCVDQYHPKKKEEKKGNGAYGFKTIGLLYGPILQTARFQNDVVSWTRQIIPRFSARGSGRPRATTTMEEAKAAAYYEELTRRGEGAARFKQGLGFSSTSSENKSNSEDAPARGAYASSSPFMSKFVKATKTTSEIESIQNKLKRKRPDPAREENEEAKPNSKSKSPPLPRVSERDRRMRRSRSGSGSRERRSRRRRSRSRERDSDRRRRRSGSESDDGDRRRRRRSPSPQYRRKDRRRSRSRSRSLSRARERSRGKVDKERSGGGGGSAGYSKLIQGYDKMSAAERVKAKMKLQLAETAEKDTTKGTEGWERFEFNKDAPLDDEEVEAADDDAAVVNHIGKSFRFSSFETKREDRIKAAHDEAMFGASDNAPTIVIENEIEAENDNKDNKEEEPPSLLSEKVLAKKQGSWRDRIRQNKN